MLAQTERKGIDGNIQHTADDQLAERRETLRNNFKGSDDQAEYLYQDAKLIICYGQFELLTRDHEQAVSYKVCQLMANKETKGVSNGKSIF